MAQTITLSAGQISDMVEVGPGTRITVTGSAYIEYAQGNLQYAKNGVLSWQKWPKGTSNGVCDTIRRMTIRATATGSASVLIEEGFRDADTDSGYWQEQTAQLATDAAGNVIGLNNPSSGGLIPLSTVVNQFYHFHGFAGNQLAGDPKFFDLAAGNHGVFGANLSNSAAWSNVGYVSTVDPSAGVTDSVIRIPSLNFDYSGGEKLIVWWLGAATPEGADVTLMGDGSNTTAGNQGLRIRMNTTGKLSNVLYGQGNSAFSGTTTGAPFDGSLHSFSVMFDGETKKYGMWVDDVLDASIPNSYAQLAAGVDVDTRTTNTFNIGASSRSPGGTEGSAVKTRALVILRLPAAKSVPLASELTSLFTALRANAGKPIAYGAI